MKSDEVQNVGDTHEATRVLKIIKEVYEQEIAYGDWDHLKFLGQITGLSDVTSPTALKIPDNVAYIEKFRYEKIVDSRKAYPKITHIEDPQEFLDIVLSRDNTASEIEEVVVPAVDTVNIFVYNDRNPSYWTSFDGVHVVCDAYDNTVSTTLTTGRTLVTGKRETTWSATNSFVPDLPTEMFPYFLSRCTVVANERLADKAAGVDRQAEQRGRSRLRNNGDKTDERHKEKKHGRR